MGKKKSSTGLLYLIGMIAVVVGCFLPIIEVNLGFLGSIKTNVIKAFQSLNTANSWYQLIMFVAAIAGVVFCFLGGKNSGLIKLIALVATIVAGIIFFVNAGFFDHFFKIVGVGFFVIIGGWIVAAIGYFTGK